MNVTLQDTEIKQAIVNYLDQQGINITGKEVSVLLFSGRKGNGFKADVQITTPKVEVEPVPEQQELPLDEPNKLEAVPSPEAEIESSDTEEGKTASLFGA